MSFISTSVSSIAGKACFTGIGMVKTPSNESVKTKIEIMHSTTSLADVAGQFSIFNDRAMAWNVLAPLDADMLRANLAQASSKDECVMVAERIHNDLLVPFMLEFYAMKGEAGRSSFPHIGQQAPKGAEPLLLPSVSAS